MLGSKVETEIGEDPNSLEICVGEESGALVSEGKEEVGVAGIGEDTGMLIGRLSCERLGKRMVGNKGVAVL